MPDTLPRYVDVVFSNITISSAFASSEVRFYTDAHSSYDSTTSAMAFNSRVHEPVLRLSFPVRPDFGPDSDPLAALRCRLYNMDATSDNGQRMAREAGDAVMRWSDLRAWHGETSSQKVLFIDFPGLLESQETRDNDVLIEVGSITFDRVSVELRDGSPLPARASDQKALQRRFNQYIKNSYDVYKGHGRFANYRPVLPKYNWFVVPHYEMEGLLVPSAMVGLMSQFECRKATGGRVCETFFRNLLLVALYEKGMHPVEVLSAEPGTDTYVRAVRACVHALTVFATVFPYASDVAYRRSAFNGTASGRHTRRTGFDLQTTDKGKDKVTVDRASFDLFDKAFDCEDGSHAVYRLWMLLVRMRKVWKDELVRAAANILDQYVVLITKVVCMGAPQCDEKKGEMCHILSVVVSRPYLAHMLRNCEPRFREYAKQVVQWPDSMYLKEEDVKVDFAIPLSYHDRAEDAPVTKVLPAVPQHPSVYFNPKHTGPHVLYAEPTAPTTCLHGTWDTLYSSLPKMGLRELEQHHQALEWWTKRAGKDRNLAALEVNSDFPPPIVASDAIARKRTQCTSFFYNAMIGVSVPGPAVVEGLEPESGAFIDVVLSSEDGVFGVFHNELACASRDLRVVPTIEATGADLRAGWRAIHTEKKIMCPRNPLPLKVALAPKVKGLPLLVHVMDDDELRHYISEDTVQGAHAIYRAVFPIVHVPGTKEYKQRVTYVIDVPEEA